MTLNYTVWAPSSLAVSPATANFMPGFHHANVQVLCCISTLTKTIEI